MKKNEERKCATTLVFISGLFAGDWIWDGVIDQLSDEYIIIKQKNPLSETGGKIEILRKELLELIHNLDSENVVLIGNSLGGLLAIDLATHAPKKISGIVVSGSPGMRTTNLGIGPPKRGSKIWFKTLSEKLFIDQNCITDEHVDLAASFFDDRKNFINMIRLAKQADKYDIKKALAEVKCPIKMIWGEDDFVTPANDWLEYLNEIQKEQFTLIENSGHSPMMEKPFEFYNELKNFLYANI